MQTQITAHRANLVLGAQEQQWLLFFVVFPEPPSQPNELSFAERWNRSQVYVLDLVQMLRHLAEQDESLLNRDEIMIPIPPKNRVNRNLLVHLWGTSLWTQSIWAAKHAAIQTDIRRFSWFLRSLTADRSIVEIQLPSPSLVNEYVRELNPLARRVARVPTHASFGASWVNSLVNKSRQSVGQVRGYCHLDKMGHVLCFAFLRWYHVFNKTSSACSSGNIVRVAELGHFAQLSIYERMLAFQMLKIQLHQGVRIILRRSMNAHGESQTVFFPRKISVTRIYEGREEVDARFDNYRKKGDPVDWNIDSSNDIDLRAAPDLYHLKCLELLALDKVPYTDLHGNGVPDFLFPWWWRLLSDASAAVMS